MRRILTSLLCCVLTLVLSSCGTDTASSGQESTVPRKSGEDQAITFSGLNDTDLLVYLEDSVGAALDGEQNDNNQVESVAATYVSKEYVEELSYNSQENVYFGYTLSELERQFDGTPYVFTLGKDGKTTVKAFKPCNDMLAQIMRNVAIGAGVILLTATVSVATQGMPVSVILACSAKSGAALGSLSGITSAATTGILEYLETGDLKTASMQAAKAGSQSFAWGAIGGAIAGGISKAFTYPRAKPEIPTWRQAEKHALWKYGGTEQVAYLNGTKVPFITENSTRPDIIRTVRGHMEAIEVKDYDLENNYSGLLHKLKGQLSERRANLPHGATQRVALSVTGRAYSKKFVRQIKKQLQKDLAAADNANAAIPIDILW